MSRCGAIRSRGVELPSAIRWPTVVLLTVGVCALAIGFLPAALIPIQNDDLVFTLLDNANSSTAPFPNGVVAAEVGAAFDQGRASIGAALAVGLERYVSWTVPATLGISVGDFEPITSFAWAFAAVAAASGFAWVAWRPLTRRVAQPAALSAAAFMVVAMVVGAVIQIHSRWSNDPVVSFGERGWGAAGIGFLYLTALFAAMQSPRVTRWWLIGLILAGLATVFWYEMLWGLPVVASLVLALWVRGGRHGRAIRSRALRVWVAIALVPWAAALVVALLLGTGMQATSYSGLQISLDAAGVKSALTALAGTIPGAAWNLSRQQVGFSTDWRALAVAAFAAVLGLLAILGLNAIGASARPYRHSGREVMGRLEWWLPVLAVTLFWLSCVLIVATTAKYQAENPMIGSVYTFYIPATLSLGVLGYALLVCWWETGAGVRWLLGAASVGVLCVLIQSSFNWSLLDLQRQDLAPTARILELLSSPVASEQDRCEASAALRAAAFPWYGYPIEDMLTSVDTLHKRSFGSPWCAEPRGNTTVIAP